MRPFAPVNVQRGRVSDMACAGRVRACCALARHGERRMSKVIADRELGVNERGSGAVRLDSAALACFAEAVTLIARLRAKRESSPQQVRAQHERVVEPAGSNAHPSRQMKSPHEGGFSFGGEGGIAVRITLIGRCPLNVSGRLNKLASHCQETAASRRRCLVSRSERISEPVGSINHPRSKQKRPQGGGRYCFGGEGGIRTHVPGYPDHLISSQRRCDRFGTSPGKGRILPALRGRSQADRRGQARPG